VQRANFKTRGGGSPKLTYHKPLRMESGGDAPSPQKTAGPSKAVSGTRRDGVRGWGKKGKSQKKEKNAASRAKLGGRTQKMSEG